LAGFRTCFGRPKSGSSTCYVWHPALLVFSVYMIVLSSLVLLVAAR
jgi:hypothetical protein